MGYGNNAVEMETTMTLDKETDEWIVHTPTVQEIDKSTLKLRWTLEYCEIRGKIKGTSDFKSAIMESLKIETKCGLWRCIDLFSAEI